MNMKWIYKNKTFGSKHIPDDSVGFVYQIECQVNSKKYIGKKNFWSTRTLKPLKGKKRKRKVTKESDWKDYYGSSNALHADIVLYGKDKFTRTILEICYGKGELNYAELTHQVNNQVLLDESWYNGIIQVRISSTHFKKI